MATIKNLTFLLLLSIAQIANCQEKVDSILIKIDAQEFAIAIGKKVDLLQKKLISRSEKTLSRLQKQEERIYQEMLLGKDSMIAKASLLQIKDKYEGLQKKLKNPITGLGSQYISKLDSLTTALKFLNKNGAEGKVKNVLKKTEELQNTFQKAEEIKQFIRQRKEELKKQLEQLGWAKQLKKYNKEIYYYSEQIKEYKEVLRDSRKTEKKVIELLSKTKLFNDFMRKNSMLASLFRLPGDTNDPLTQASLAGLQTRVQTNNLIQQQIASGGPNAMSQFQQNMQSAQSQISKLKDEIAKSGSGSSDDIMPEGFKPNNQKTKIFLKRLELGTNTQTQKATNFFPVTSDLGLWVGYKLNDKSIIGIGGSYKLGLGRGWNHIKVTSEGVGLRSFVDWKLKGSFWLSGGYEQNYKAAFKDFSQLQNLSGWQQSGLIGLTKVVDVKSKFFKKTKLQLLWDFLSYQQLPRTQPVVFRVGYNF